MMGVRPLGDAARAVEPAADFCAGRGWRCSRASAPDDGFACAADATSAAFGIDAFYTTTGGEPCRCG
jgi:hypothetical protein